MAIKCFQTKWMIRLCTKLGGVIGNTLSYHPGECMFTLDLSLYIPFNSTESPITLLELAFGLYYIKLQTLFMELLEQNPREEICC